MLTSVSVFADDITLTIDTLDNVANNTALEACGTAIHKAGLHPLVVTVVHGGAYHTTLTAPNGKWCVMFERLDFSGTVDATATTLTQ